MNKMKIVILLFLLVGIIYVLWPKVYYEQRTGVKYPRKRCSCAGYKIESLQPAYKLGTTIKDVCLGIVYDCGQFTEEEQVIIDSAAINSAFEKDVLTDVVTGGSGRLAEGYLTNGVDIGWCWIWNMQDCTVLEMADTDSFEVLQQEHPGYAKDKNNVYRGAQILEGEDPDAFILPEE